MFEESLGSKHTVKIYTWYLKKFMKFHDIKNFDDIISLDKKIIQQYVELYVIQIKKEVSPNSISTYANPIKTFLEMNDIDLNWRKIKRLYPTMVKKSGNSAYSTADVKKMLDSTTILRNKAIIHFLASTGVRIGSVNEIRLRHLRDMPQGCKMVTVYENSTEEYFTFLTPEATTALNDSFDERRKHGEMLSEDSPLFRQRFLLVDGSMSTPISKESLQGVISRALKKTTVRGQKINGRYKEQLAHGFRKRFNTILKLNNEVNDNAIEKMMGHKKGLDGTYFQGTVDELFNEFAKGIIDLTVDQTEKQQVELSRLESEKSELAQIKEENVKFKKELLSKIMPDGTDLIKMYELFLKENPDVQDIRIADH